MKENITSFLLSTRLGARRWYFLKSVVWLDQELNLLLHQCLFLFHLDDNWQQAEAWLMLFVGAVEVNALAAIHSVAVNRTPNLPIERRTLCHWAIAAPISAYESWHYFIWRYEKHDKIITVLCVDVNTEDLQKHWVHRLETVPKGSLRWFLAWSTCFLLTFRIHPVPIKLLTLVPCTGCRISLRGDYTSELAALMESEVKAALLGMNWIH